MDNMKKEPDILRKGKKFHQEIQDEWHETAEGEVVSEKTIIKPDGTKGRIDIHVTSDGNLVCVAEIKMTDWDAMTDKSARKNINRYVNQIWKYIDSQLLEGKDVSPGIIFPLAPDNPERKLLIEEMFNENGIQVVWQA